MGAMAEGTGEDAPVGVPNEGRARSASIRFLGGPEPEGSGVEGADDRPPPPG